MIKVFLIPLIRSYPLLRFSPEGESEDPLDRQNKEMPTKHQEAENKRDPYGSAPSPAEEPDPH